MDKHQSKIIILASLLISITIVALASTRAQPPGDSSGVPLIANAQVPQQSSVGSPDGKMTLTMKTQKGKDTSVYSFVVSNTATGSQNQIFTKTLPVGSSLSIPQNTFSPDDKYVFLKETDEGIDTYLVLSTSGASLTKDGSTLEISSLFGAKYPDYRITDVTGWGGTTLIVVNVDKATGGTGPSFWFDVSSHSFILLGTRFN